MDELDIFRDFRRGVAAPGDEVQRRVFARVASAVDGEQTPRTSALRLIGKRRFGAVALVALAGATAAALFVGTPWNDSPGFLQRAQAALTSPAGMILHEKWEVTSTFTDPACSVTRGPNEIWIDETPPYRYRTILNGPPTEPANADLRALLCSSGTESELGGTLDPQQTLRFVPPNTLRAMPRARVVFPLDPVTELREAISAGRAHDEGETQLDGRTVERIRIDPGSDCPDPNCPREPSYAYVEPETFYPVQLESPNGVILLGSVVRFHFVLRTLTFEYLSRTTANLALTDIGAQHPHATVVNG